MAGHSHWAGIKHQKEVTDKKRGKVFSKLLMAIAAAAKTEPNPDFNPRLRSAIEKAKSEKVPGDVILRAISRAKESGVSAEECLFEAYGPEGVAMLIFCITENRNRLVQEVKKSLSDHDAKWAEPGSVLWAFDEPERNTWNAKFPQAISESSREKLDKIIRELEEHDDVQKVFTSAST